MRKIIPVDKLKMNRTYLQTGSIFNQWTLYMIVIVLSLSFGLIFDSVHHLIYAKNYNNKQNLLDNGTNLQITTNKHTYRLGEKVIITIKNNLRIPLKFSDSLLGLTIKNVQSGQVGGLVGTEVRSELKPNESKSFQWDEKDTNANQVKPGIYEAKCFSITKDLHTTRPFIANTTFSITRP